MATVPELLEQLELVDVPDAIDYMEYRASAKREYATEVETKGHDLYGKDIRDDAALLDLAAMLLRERGRQ